ncbi:MAG TPA: SH3 domain-containing protein, partial [Bacteriovoracaceae bacterium]|nr:SH3 domain-containing protein [Bacteriovoracaceae bacterium]
NFKKSKNLRHFLMITVVMVMLSGLSLWTRHWPWSVAEQEVDVYHGPSEIFDKVQVVPKGIKFLGLEKDSWIKIIYPSRFEGWVKKENISEL